MFENNQLLTGRQFQLNAINPERGWHAVDDFAIEELKF
jgi:hypothetical protein